MTPCADDPAFGVLAEVVAVLAEPSLERFLVEYGDGPPYLSGQQRRSHLAPCGLCACRPSCGWHRGKRMTPCADIDCDAPAVVCCEHCARRLCVRHYGAGTSARCGECYHSLAVEAGRA